MAKNMLRISDDVSFPLNAVTQTFAILGKRGSGKTNTSGVMTEQMIRAGLPVIAVDPIGVWWGLRHAADGKGPGLPVVILGGEHADIPLEETGGSVIADFIIEHRSPMVLDLGLFSKSAQRRFMVDFAERLYLKNREALHVVLDEVDTFCPQRIEHGGERLVGAINDIVRKGRARGLGVTLISQRPALVNKDVLTQVECLIAHRMTGPHDRDAIERWVEHNADKNQAKTVLASLQSLATGDAWVWSPGWLELFKRTHINLRETFDSSATPKAGDRVTAPKQAAAVDLEALRQKLTSTIEKAKADDPKELRRRIAELEKAQPKSEVKIERVEVPVISPEVAAGLQLVAKEIGEVAESLRATADEIANALKRMDVKLPVVALRPVVHSGPARPVLRPMPKLSTEPNGSASNGLSKCARELLRVLVQRGLIGSTDSHLSILSGYSIKSSGFSNAKSELRTKGFMATDFVGRMVATEDGFTHAGHIDPLPTGTALIEYWKSNLDKCPRMFLDALCKAYPRELTKEELSEATGYSMDSSGFSNGLSTLRTLELAQGRGSMKASDVFFEVS